ncbi:MAG: exopolysaccharide biosynthesis polyprenyl glycosylphosphotransferase [Caulobacteraceae bacterium]
MPATDALGADAAESPARALLRQAEQEIIRRTEVQPKPARARGAERRGPFRPGRLVPIRSRMSGADVAARFRHVDTLSIWLLAFAGVMLATGGSPLSAPLGVLLPYAAGAGLLTWSLSAFKAYNFGPREGLSGHWFKVAFAFVLTAIAGAAYVGVSRTPSATALAMLLGVAFSGVYLSHGLWWRMVDRWRVAGKLTPNVVVVGATKNAERLIQTLLETREANVLGVFDDRLDRAPDALCGVPVLGTTSALLGHRITPFVDRVIITVPAAAQGRVTQIIERLRVLPNDVSLFLEFDQGARAISRLADAPIARVCGNPNDLARAKAKRWQDLILGALMLIALTPVMALIALAVRLDSPGPIFFRQRRHGFNNEEIVVWKFRSMRADAADATACKQVVCNDDRVTRVGRFIRKTSLDELPQLLNVLTGEMSIVGPRPHAIGMKTGDTESARLVAEYAHRHRLKPGITGWAAIKGSRGPVHTPEDVRQRVAYDVEYIERQSLWLDLYIIAMTLPCLLGDRAAVR